MLACVYVCTFWESVLPAGADSIMKGRLRSWTPKLRQWRRIYSKQGKRTASNELEAGGPLPAGWASQPAEKGRPGNNYLDNRSKRPGSGGRGGRHQRKCTTYSHKLNRLPPTRAGESSQEEIKSPAKKRGRKEGPINAHSCIGQPKGAQNSSRRRTGWIMTKGTHACRRKVSQTRVVTGDKEARGQSRKGTQNRKETQRSGMDKRRIARWLQEPQSPWNTRHYSCSHCRRPSTTDSTTH